MQNSGVFILVDCLPSDTIDDLEIKLKIYNHCVTNKPGFKTHPFNNGIHKQSDSATWAVLNEMEFVDSINAPDQNLIETEINLSTKLSINVNNDNISMA